MASKIPKFFAWDLYPGYDFYLWLDSALTFRHAHAVQWFTEHLHDHDIAFFTHWQTSVRQEIADLKVEIARDKWYTGPRYAGEDLEGSYAPIRADHTYVDDRFWCGGAFCYRPTDTVKAAMKEWWYRVSRFAINDQLHQPHVFKDCRVHVIHADIYKNDYLRWVRPLKQSCNQVTAPWLDQPAPTVRFDVNASPIRACVIHQSSNTEREPLVAEIERRVPGTERVEAIMRPNGVHGCSLSQKAIIARAQAERWPAVWIMEDDCVFTSHFDLETWFRTVDLALEAGYQIVVGGSANGQQPSKSPIRHLVTVQGFSSCHCWVARADAYDAILSVDINTPIDVAISALALKKACRVPLIARQHPSLSSIQHIYEDYTLLFDNAERTMLPFLVK